MLLAFQRATLKAGSGLACKDRNALNSCLRPCGGQVQMYLSSVVSGGIRLEG